MQVFEDAIIEMTAIDEESLLPLEEALRKTEPHQIFEPGTVTSYSNWSSALAGLIVERISGMSFTEYVHTNIFEPLGMEHTGIDPAYRDHPRVKEQLLNAEGYTATLDPISDGLFYLNLYPAGSAAGTLDDFIRFGKALLPNSEGQAKLFNSPETLRAFHEPTATFPETNIPYNSHGLWVEEHAVYTYGHAGNTMMYSSNLIFDPLSQIGLVVMTNQSNDFIYNYGLPPLIFGETGEMIERTDPVDTTHMDDLYYSSRTTRNGIGKMYTYMGIAPYSSDANGNLSASLFGLANVDSIQIAPNIFITTQEIGDVDLHSISRFSNEEGVKKLTSPYGVSVESDLDVYLMIAALTWFLLAVIWSLALLLTIAVQALFRKIKDKPQKHLPFKKQNILLSLTTIGLLANVLVVAQALMNAQATYSSLRIHVVISLVLAIVPFLSVLRFRKNWAKSQEKTAHKIRSVITLVMGFSVTFAVIVMELYKL